jgi:pentapeptide repeat protein
MSKAKERLGWLVAGGGAVLLASAAYAAIPSPNGVVDGCYDKSSGDLRIIDPSTTTCTHKELPISWNQIGPSGPAGPPGNPGPAGPPGPASTVLCPSCELSQAPLAGAVLPGALLWYATLAGTDLSGADLRGAELRGARFGVDVFTHAPTDLSGADLTDANLSFAWAYGGVGSLGEPTTTGAVWSNTTCPDGTNSDDNAGTCDGHFAPLCVVVGGVPLPDACPPQGDDAGDWCRTMGCDDDGRCVWVRQPDGLTTSLAASGQCVEVTCDGSAPGGMTFATLPAGTDCTLTDGNASKCLDSGYGNIVCIPSCTDGVKDNDESDVDCGGGCGQCNIGQVCAQDQDCMSFACPSGVCVASCHDGIQNGDETDVDCGGGGIDGEFGGGCNGCHLGSNCVVYTDCRSSECTAGVCMPAIHCSNAAKDSNETAVDCGGGDCLGCGPNEACSGNGDCASNHCVFHLCT